MQILVGLDGSETGQAAMARAIAEVQRTGGRLHPVAHVPRPATAEGLPRFEADRVAHQQQLDAAIEEVRAKGIECVGHLPISQLDPSGAILHTARVEKVDLIVIGLRPRTRVGKLLLGSNAQDILLGADCDVLAVKAA
jgi:nucleotide-binding universal stress UspA family protein